MGLKKRDRFALRLEIKILVRAPNANLRARLHDWTKASQVAFAAGLDANLGVSIFCLCHLAKNEGFDCAKLENELDLGFLDTVKLPMK